jgi:hypothetical protein
MKEISKQIFLLKIGKNGNFYTFFEFFAVHTITFLKGPQFGQKTPKN